MKKHLLLCFLSLSVLAGTPSAQAAFYKRTAQQQYAVSNNSAAHVSAATGNSAALTHNTYDMPRGRGNGRAATMSSGLGIFALIPFIGLVFAAIALPLGLSNMSRYRKGRGKAIAGVVLSVVGILFSIFCILILL